MSIARTFQALEIYDILTNLVPGGILLLSVSVVIKIEEYVSFQNSGISIGISLIAAFVLGHVIQAIASQLNGTPTLFGRIVRSSKGEDVDDLSVRITHIEESLWPMVKRKFSLPEDFDDYGALMRLLISHLETIPATRALRFQALFSFHRSMWAVSMIVAGLVMVGVFLKCLGIVAVRSYLILVVTAIGSLMSILIFRSRKEKFNRLFVQYTIVDFYSDQIDEVSRLKRPAE
ncbi:hypothetical protein [Halobaculum marinum]|uniref:Uncharacterized protein n=1 Tax=Halobaculum marinum TaxID=3031996 RepID=A0ABD5WZ02_9EURY|nr:hypothetical protein [Halobaculum sp. DT55]